jgi:predicted ester cyclase
LFDNKTGLPFSGQPFLFAETMRANFAQTINMGLEENKQVVIRFNKEFIELGNTEVLQEIVAPSFINHTIPQGFPNDVSGLIQFIGVLRTGFPDLHVNILQQVAENDLVTTLKTLEGTHTGTVMGHAPTGKKVTMTVIDMVRIHNGQYVDHWGKNDVMQVIQQLGAG